MANTIGSVPSSFDDQLEAFNARIKTEGWDKKLGIDVKSLDADLKNQRSEKTKDQALKQDYETFHRNFTTAQTERYQRYMTALGVVRAAHRNEPAVLKSLETFKRKQAPRGSRKKSEPTK